MTELQTISPVLPPTAPETLELLQTVHEDILKCEPVAIGTEHILHGGMYARTIRLEPGTVVMGALIKLATLLIVAGSASLLGGDSQLDLEGYYVIPGSAGRKQLVVARGHAVFTMVFPTQAKTVEAAEDEVFAEAHLLLSRKDGSRDTVTITGE